MLYTSMFTYEEPLWKKGAHYIVGIDEVGRGAFAGPVVAAGVVFAKDSGARLPKGIVIRDSKKIFPAYLLVKMHLDDNVWLAVRTTPGVTGFVGSGDKPTPLSDNEVMNIMKFTSSPAPRYKTKITIGEAVKVTDGPFSDMLGSVKEIDEEKGKVTVLLSIFGRETPVELDFLQISKV